MKKLFFPIMFLLAAGSMQAQTYNELVEKAMDYTLKDSLVGILLRSRPCNCASVISLQ